MKLIVNGTVFNDLSYMEKKELIQSYKNLIWGSVLDGSFQPKG